MSNVLVWFRSDLRLRDNPAFFNAIRSIREQNNKSSLVALYVISPKEWKAHDVSRVKVHFILRNLASLSQRLWTNYRIPLIIKTAPNGVDDVVSTVQSLCRQWRIKEVHWNKEYEVNESRRDARLLSLLTKQENGSIQVCEYHDQCVVLPGTLRAKSSGNVYTVYSPFKKSWFDQVRNYKKKYLTVLEEPGYGSSAAFQNNVEGLKGLLDGGADVGPSVVPVSVTGFEVDAGMAKTVEESWPAGEPAALEKLKLFAESKNLPQYEDQRNFPAKTGTSGLSPYLASGVLSAKVCVVKAMEMNHGHLDTGSKGIVVWIQELIWRDFYRHILVEYPRVCMNRPFKLDTEKVKWRYDEKQFEAWCQGKTGYPIVDAAMRQLNQTGWMHNRSRMIVASFLTKHLLLDWRQGEKYFMQHLIDGDLASNNGGWQWAASTGTDAQPYFRVFNPLLQSQRFDESGEYIKKYVPELRSLKTVAAVHDPESVLGKAGVEKLGYYPKIVQHEMARKRAIEAFQITPKASGKNEEESESEEEVVPAKKQRTKK